MNKKFISKITALALSASVLTSVPFYQMSSVKAEEVLTEKDGEYTYEIWNQMSNGQLYFDSDKSIYSCGFEDYDDVFYRYKKVFDSDWNWRGYGSISLNYDADITCAGTDNNILVGLYGFFKNTNDEFYILDGWGSYRPQEGKTPLETVEIDGVLYDIYRVQRLAMSGIQGTATTTQYWSIRRENLLGNSNSGNVSSKTNLSEHIKVWEKYDPYLKKASLYDAGFYAEGFRSGRLDISLNSFELETEYSPEKGDTEKPYEYAPLKNTAADLFKLGVVAEPYVASGNKKTFSDNFSSLSLRDGISIDQNMVIEGKEGNDAQISYKMNAENDELIKYAVENGLDLDTGTFIDLGKLPAELFTDDNQNTVSREVIEKRLDAVIKSAFDSLASYEGCNTCSADIYFDIFDYNYSCLGNEKSADSSYYFLNEIYKDKSFIDEIFSICKKYAPEGCSINLKLPSDCYTDDSNSEYIVIAKVLKVKKLLDKISLGFNAVPGSVQTKEGLENYKSGFFDAVDTFITFSFDIKISNTYYTHYDPSIDEMFSSVFEFYASNFESISEVCMDSSAAVGLLDNMMYTTEFFDSIDKALKTVMNNGIADISENNDTADVPGDSENTDTTDTTNVTDTVDYLKGDANGDGCVNSQDLTEFIKIMLCETEDVVVQDSMDIDGDGRISVLDLIYLKNMLLNE